MSTFEVTSEGLGGSSRYLIVERPEAARPQFVYADFGYGGQNRANRVAALLNADDAA